MCLCVHVFMCLCVHVSVCSCVRVLHDVEDGVLQLDGVETLPPASHGRMDVQAEREEHTQVRSNPNPN